MTGIYMDDDEIYLKYLEHRYKIAESSLVSGMPEKRYDVDARIKSGICGFDSLTGGLARGYVTEISGEDDTGKTALALTLCAAVQQSGGVAVYFDVEGKFDCGFARKLGVDVSKLIIIDVSVISEVCQICEILFRSNAVDLVVIDTITAVLSSFEENGCSDVKRNYNAVNDNISHLNYALQKSDCCLVVTGQTRSNLNRNIPVEMLSAVPDIIKSKAWLRVSLIKGTHILCGDRAVGNTVDISIIRKKDAVCNERATLEFYYDTGFA